MAAEDKKTGEETALDVSHDETAHKEAPAGHTGEVEGHDAEIAALEAQLEAARNEASEHLDKFLRATAEVENTRRRAEIDVANAHKYAVERFAGEILTVRDSLELAQAAEVNAEEGAEVISKMLEGVELTLKQLDNVFEKFDMAIINPEGEKFDPERHQAISMVETADVDPNHVLSVVQKGCTIGDRLLRPAMVVVAKAPATG